VLLIIVLWFTEQSSKVDTKLNSGTVIAVRTEYSPRALAGGAVINSFEVEDLGMLGIELNMMRERHLSYSTVTMLQLLRLP